MDVWVWIVVLGVAVLVGLGLGMAALSAQQRRRRQELRDWFGLEYDRGVSTASNRRKGERSLASRVGRRSEVEIRPLSDAAREGYATQWAELERRFVVRRLLAVVDAQELCARVMRDRGYPVDDFESQAESISVDHPEVVRNYRKGHAIYSKTLGGEASTEDVRQAVVAYRALFGDLLDNAARSDEHAHH